MHANDVEALSRRWINEWIDGDPRSLPLAADFEHLSPWGRIAGRETYLDEVIPKAKENVAELAIINVIVGTNESVVRYRYRQTSSGGEPIEVCDWLRFRDGEIVQVKAFFGAFLT